MKVHINNKPKEFVMPKYSIGQKVYIHQRRSASICEIKDAHFYDGKWTYDIESEHLDKIVKRFTCRESCLTEKIHQTPNQYANIVVP